MIEHYNAFISYKHAPEDNKVAEAVQRGLEHFSIPGPIKKKTGIKKIERVFRDKDELPITSNLSESIAYALEHSDYLIVICSTRTKESIWVTREIEYFLRNHTKSQILTVLVDGEPQDVIPSELTFEDRVYQDQYGHMQTMRVPLEPLSCDYRMPLKKAKKVELPRLASVLLGCSYDELMNRQRQYTNRRLLTGFSVVMALALAFMGYMIYANRKVQKAYVKSLRNQSVYLANESDKLLEDQRRITAMQLALEALPKDDKDPRPVTPEAIRSLSKALLAYEVDMGTNIHAEWNYTMRNIIAAFEVSNDDTRLVAMDENGIVALWDTRSHEQIEHIHKKELTPLTVKIVNDDTFVVLYSTQVYAYSLLDGKELWNCELEDMIYGSNAFSDGQRLYLDASTKEIVVINLSDGKQESKIELPLGDEDSLVEFEINESGTRIAYAGLKGWDKYFMAVCDLKDGKNDKRVDYDHRVEDMAWADDDHIIVSVNTKELGDSMSFGAMSIYSSDVFSVKCYTSDDLIEKWNADFESNDVLIQNEFVPLPERKAVAYYNGNVMTTYEINTGKVLNTCNVNDSIVVASDPDGDGWPAMVTEGGELAFPDRTEGSNIVQAMDVLAEDLNQAVIRDGLYVKEQVGNEIIHYGLHVVDSDWKELGLDNIDTALPDASYLGEKGMAFLIDTDLKPELAIAPIDSAGKLHILELDEDSLYNYHLLGEYEDKMYVGEFASNADYNLLKVDIKSGDVEKEKLVENGYDTSGFVVLEGNNLIYFETENSEKYIVRKNLKSGDESKVKLDADVGSLLVAPCYSQKNDTAYLAGDKDYIVSFENKKAKEVKLPEGWLKTQLITQCEDGSSFAASDQSGIILVNKKGKVKLSINCPDIAPIGMTYYNNGKTDDENLVVVYDKGEVYRYSLEDGEIIDTSDISVYQGYKGDVNFSIDYDNSVMYVQMDELLDIVNMEDFCEFTYINQCVGHHKGTDRFITYKSVGESISLGYFERYTDDELIEKANSVLNGLELTDEQKSEYGLKDD